MRDTELWEEWHIRHVATHCDGSKFARIGIFLTGFARFVVAVTIHRPDIVHLHTSERGSFVRKGILVWVSSLFRLPVILHMHGGEFHEYFEGSPPSVQRLIRATLQRADIVIALGNTWAERLREAAPGARIEIVPNAIRSNVAVDQESRGEVQVTFLGELCDRKGTSLLIDAWAEMLRRGDAASAKLTIAGWGQIERARDQVSALGVESTVSITGWLSAAEAGELLANSHVLVLPSFNEGQPMAILEAMARGICVVSTKTGGIPEMIGECDGILVNPGQVVELANALATVVSHPETRRQLGESARRRAEREFNVEVITRRLHDLYLAALAGRRQQPRDVGLRGS